MTRISNMVIVITLVVVATMLQSSSGQTSAPAPSPSRPPMTYTVGDSLGWLVPPGGPIAYETWARGKTFMVGDILVFNFTNGAHDVAEVRKAGFDSCNSSAATNTINTSPARITLTTVGEHFYICTFPQHCSLGQKLAINVTRASSAPAQPPATPPPATTPSPVATPAPSPSRPPMTYTVGDSLGWLVPPGGPIAYETWARGKNFMVGDILVFNFTNGAHDVAEVRRAGFDSCNNSTATNTINTSPARITLTTAGEHFYICTFPQHCSLGQKLAINVTGANSATPPSSPSPTPSSTTTPPPSTTTPPPSSDSPTPPSIPTSPSPFTAPPPPDSAAPTSFRVAALPFTLLSIALAFLY